MNIGHKCYVHKPLTTYIHPFYPCVYSMKIRVESYLVYSIIYLEDAKQETIGASI